MASRSAARLSPARRAANRKALERSLGGLRQLRAQGALTPREGQGDYRRPEQATMAVRNGRTAPDSIWHNPAPVRGAGSGHAERAGRQVFLPIRNGQPEFLPYVYGAARPSRAIRGLDYAAIAAADAEIDGKMKQQRSNAAAQAYRRRAGVKPNRRATDCAVPQELPAPGAGLTFRVRETT